MFEQVRADMHEISACTQLNFDSLAHGLFK
jgi:hypothetical protein